MSDLLNSELRLWSPVEPAAGGLHKYEGGSGMANNHGNVRVHVTEADIDKGEPNSSMRCVVARAIARTMPGATRIDVDTQTVRWSHDGERFVYLTPYSVAGYVIAFDAGDTIEPFTFVLRSDRRVPVKQKVRTEAGKEVKKVHGKARRAKEKVQQLEQTAKGKPPSLLDDPMKPWQPPSTAQRGLAKEQLPAAKAQLAEAEEKQASVTAAYADAIKSERIGDGRPDAVPRVFKRSERHYGQRLLRINQPGS